MQADTDLAAEQQVFGRRLFAATRKAWVTPLIVAINVIVFAAMLFDGAGLLESNPAVHLRWGANFGPVTKEGEWWRLLTSTFLHFGILHVGMNMWALWSAGALVERLYGNLTFLGLYLFAGIAGSLVSLLWNADRVVSAGASGAIFGVYGALGAYVLRQPGSVPRGVLKSLTGSTVAFILYSIVIGVMVPAIDNAAHAGGLVGGFVLAWVLARPLEPRAPLGLKQGAMAGGVAVILLGALFTVIPAPRYSYQAQQAAVTTIQQFAAEEAALAKKAGELIDARRAGRMTDPQLGAAIEKDLLPGWNAAHARFSALRVDPQAPAAEKLRALTEVIGVRRDMFTAYALGLQLGDANRLKQAEELSARSLALMKAIRERQEKK
jgi:rhomboid protease GluP